MLRGVVALALLVPLGLAIARYPLGWEAPLAAALAYALLLWRLPAAFLVVLPIVIPGVDLGMWTGWTLVEESDLFILLTLAVLLVRMPPAWPHLPRWAQWIIGLFALFWCLGIAIGLANPITVLPSANVFLQPDNALRVGKSAIEALLLWPFIAARQHRSGDALKLFAAGLSAGLACVTLIVIAERLLFADALDFSGAYRVSGPFTSMRVGGGHIGAYTAMVLPFTLCLSALRPRWTGMTSLLIGLAAGTYTLTATLARTAYAGGAVGLGVLSVGWLRGMRIAGRTSAAGLLPVALVVAALGGVAAFTGMRARFADTATDFSTREGNWRAGLAARDTAILPTLFGSGLGSYQRSMFVRSDVNRPSDLALRQDGADTVVVLTLNTPFYLGQKISVDGAPISVRLQVRAIGTPARVAVSLCDKVMLYSDQCRSAALSLTQPGVWQTMDAALDTRDLGRDAVFGLLHRPVELSLFGGPGQIEVRRLDIRDAAGRPVLANAGFTHGLDRWLITDDSHVSWRMLNVYLMMVFETGLLGAAAYLALCGAAMAAGLNARPHDRIYGAAVAGAVASFMVSGLFDDVLEAPRVATLFFLIVGCGFLLTPERSE